MTNLNPSPELHDPMCICCCRPKSEHVRKQCPETTYFIENVAALSQTPPAVQDQLPPSENGYETDNADENDYAQTPPAPGEVEREARALVQQLRLVIDRLNGQAYSSTLSQLNALSAALRSHDLEAVNGLQPTPGHADGCGAHDDYRCDCTTPTLATVAAGDDEGVARIIDPAAFKHHAALLDYCIHSGDSRADAQKVADDTHGPEIAVALAKAAAIRLLSQGGAKS